MQVKGDEIVDESFAGFEDNMHESKVSIACITTHHSIDVSLLHRVTHFPCNIVNSFTNLLFF
jgi:hypothetical protein